MGSESEPEKTVFDELNKIPKVEALKKLGFEKLPDGDLEQIAGGTTFKEGGRCPDCGSVDTITAISGSLHRSFCNDCGYEWCPND